MMLMKSSLIEKPWYDAGKAVVISGTVRNARYGVDEGVVDREVRLVLC